MIQVHANPRPFPHGGLTSSGLAVLMIDMQRDFLDPEGYLAAMGYELDGVRSAILPARRLLELARGAGLTVIHTRQGFRPDLGELAPHARARVRRGLQRLAKLGRSVAS